MCKKALLRGISIAGLALGLVFSNLYAKEVGKNIDDSNLLLKKAVLKLYRENQELEKRVTLLENKLEIGKADKNVSTTKPKSLSMTSLTRIKNEFKKGKKMVMGQTLKDAKYYSEPRSSSEVVGNVTKGKKIIIKGVIEQNGTAWYKIEDGMYVSENAISFKE